ncbi:MAG: DUF2285 domain-containing protein [Pseudomonadota bacterium]
MPRPSLEPPIADEAPWSDQVTAYDETHLVIYIQLLDALQAKATPAEITRIILGVDPQKDPGRAKKILDSHVNRARWMAQHGYKELLRGDWT